jgi:hypothetical protein
VGFSTRALFYAERVGDRREGDRPGILGAGLGRRLAAVRWGIAGRMVVARVLTLPAAALVAGAVWKGAGALGALAALVCLGALVIGFLAMTHKCAGRRAGSVPARRVDSGSGVLV